MAVSSVLNRNRQAPAEDTPAFGGIAERFRRAGDADRAIALCREGLRKFPNQLSARVTLGWALLDKGQYDAAREELEQVLRRAPDNLAAIRGLAELHDRPTEAAEIDGGAAWQREEAAATVEEPPSPMPAPAIVVEVPEPAVVQVSAPAAAPSGVVNEAPPISLVASAGSGAPTLLLKASDPVKLLMAPEMDDWLPAAVPASGVSQHIDLGAFDQAFTEFEAEPDWAGQAAEPTSVVELEQATAVFELSAPGTPSFAAFTPAQPQPALVEPVVEADVPALLAEEPAPVVEQSVPDEQPAIQAEVPALAAEVPSFLVEAPAPIAEEPSPMAEEPLPVVHEAAPMAQEPVTAVHEAVTFAYESVTLVHEPVPAVPEPVPEVRESGLEVHEPAAMTALVQAAPEPEPVFAPEPVAPAAALQMFAPRALSIVAGRAVERQRRLDALERMLRKTQARRLQMTQGSVA